ncbi:MAG: hypothetical protein PHO82_11460 [Mesotoga sp.]|uniref:hypothetical protein n=1 Tax=Mesotoga sp. TaxID=2053577 RepID=UPI0002CC5DB3|nr:hypothetical protein [Mesotoga sp.]MDD5683936.1 hypothetical protein [Mesotoga sp.]CCU85405.1 conserved hypothetical protein [Mesotoga infera]
MKTQIVRVPFETHSRLKAMASASGETIGEILAKAVESYRRVLLLEDTNEAFSKLKEQADLWKGELDEREEWEGSLLDGQSNHE